MSEGRNTEFRDKVHYYLLLLLLAVQYNIWYVSPLSRLWPGCRGIWGVYVAQGMLISVFTLPISLVIVVKSLRRRACRLLALVGLLLAAVPYPLSHALLSYYVSHLGLVYK